MGEKRNMVSEGARTESVGNDHEGERGETGTVETEAGTLRRGGSTDGRARRKEKKDRNMHRDRQKQEENAKTSVLDGGGKEVT